MAAGPTFFEDIKQYVGFGERDGAVLATLVAPLQLHFERIAEHFYERILAHPRAHAAITGGAEQVAVLKRTLVSWMESGLLGPHDEAFYERRARIGRVHVRIGLPEQYMVTAMTGMRMDYQEVLARALPDLAAFAEACCAVDRLFDLELAIMFQTYRADSEDRLRRQERLATIGQMAASIGHDLRNPLGVIESSLFIMRRKLADNEKALRHVEKIAKQVKTCDRIVHDLLDMARHQPPRLEQVEVATVFAEAIELAQPPPHVTVRQELPDGMTVLVDAGLLQQAVVNLLTNSIRAIGQSPGEVVLVAEAGDTHDRISVLDDGPGFDPGVLPLAFEPLVTTRATGIGLGLALVKSIVERHHGEVRGFNREGRGARVDIALPAPARSTP